MKWFFLFIIIVAITYMSYHSWTAAQRQLTSNAIDQNALSVEEEISSENIQNF